MRRILHVLLMAAASLAAQGSWPEIPASVWSIKASDYPETPGAVVLLERYHFHDRAMERFRRTLILGPAGRREAELTLRAEKITKLEGRTVTKDGKVLPFSNNGDIVKFNAVKVGREEVQARRLFPPGLTDACIVDVRWVEQIESNLRPVPEAYGLSFLASLSGDIPVVRAELVFDPEAFYADWTRSFQVASGQKDIQDRENGRERHVIENIPARSENRFASKAEVLLPALRWFWMPNLVAWAAEEGLAPRPITYLDAAARTVFYNALVEHVKPKAQTLASLKEMAQGVGSLPPKERALALIKRFRQQVWTLPELSELPKGSEREGDGLDQVIPRRWGTSNQIQMLVFLLFQEAGLEPRFVYAVDREEHRMHDSRDLWQYDGRFLAVPDGANGVIYLDPGNAWNPMGLPPWFQGSQALTVMPAAKRDKWRASQTYLPIESADLNTDQWTIKITPAEEEDRFELLCRASGGAAVAWRRDLFQNARGEADKQFRGWVEGRGLRVASVALEAVRDPWSPLTLKATATKDVEEGRHRVVRPFAFLRSPFPIPDLWPESCSTMIHLPATRRIQAEARIPAPPKAEGAPWAPFERSNAFGKVAWSSSREEGASGAEWVLKMSIEVNSILNPPSRYEELKAFSGWIQEALRLGVEIPKP